MSNTIDMQLMRYINLFERVSRVSTTNCFIYNNTIIFAVSKPFISKAVGKDGANVKQLGEILRKKIKVIESSDNIQKFVADVVSPVEFTKVEIKDGNAIVTANKLSKAALIGRNRIREQELADILKKFFNVQGARIL